MKWLKKTAALLLSLALLLSGAGMGETEARAADSANTSGKLVIKLSGTDKARILSGKKISQKRQSALQRAVRYLFHRQRTNRSNLLPIVLWTKNM